MTPSLNHKIKCSFELIDLIDEHKKLLIRMTAQEPDLYDHLKYIEKELTPYLN